MTHLVNRYVMLETAELRRLGKATRTRPLILGCWSFATGRKRLGTVMKGLSPIRTTALEIAARAVKAFEQ